MNARAALVRTPPLVPCCLTLAMASSLWTFSIVEAQTEAGRPEPRIERAACVTTADSQDEFPAIGRAGDGRMWLAWVSWNGQKDEVLASELGPDGWLKPAPLSENAGDCWRPAMGTDGSGRLWATWAQNRNGNWDIWASYFAAGHWSKPACLTNNPANDMCQKLVADSAGRLWMAWQAVVDQNYEILVAEVTPEGLQSVQNVSDHPASDWAPAIAADGHGGVYVGWDSYRNASYDIFVRRTHSGGMSEPVAVASTPDYEAHAALAVDGQQRLWVAWDNGGPHWGRHGEARLNLHSRRSVGLVCLQAGRRFAPQEPLDAVLVGELAQFCELPELRVDGSGRLWLFIRHLQDLTPPGRRPDGRPHQKRGIWNPVALCYHGDQWSRPARLPSSNGRNDMRVATCLDGEGKVWVAWAEDGRRPRRAEEPVNHNVHAAAAVLTDARRVELSVRAIESPGLETVAATTPSAPPRHEISVGGVNYQLLYGDTHRHTDISRCAMNVDGSLIDAYRYARDAASLDFLAISDHDQDLLKHRYGRSEQGPLQDYAWRRSQKYCDLFYIEGEFLPIYGYEHGGSFATRGGHKNVLYLERGMPCYEADSPEELFLLLRDKDAVAIPHQLADGGSATDWSKWNDQFERVAEIFQTRGSYEFFGAPREALVQREGHYLWDALGGGVRIGVIASSDHGLVHGAYAGVYAKEFTRRGVLEALRSRRTFGATETIVLDFRLGDYLLGEEAQIDGHPTFQVFARAAAPLKRVQIVRDGKFVFSAAPEHTTCRLEYTDLELSPGGSAYYYVRCQQDDNQWAWSSAIWVRRRP